MKIRRRPVCLGGVRQEVEEVSRIWGASGPIPGVLETVAKSSFFFFFNLLVYQLDGEGNKKN